jgi:hypothetical protein
MESKMCIVSITNTYDNNPKLKLKGVAVDNDTIERSMENIKIKHYAFKNYKKSKLFKALSLISQLANSGKYTQLLLVYSGHGFYSTNNKFSGIVTNDNEDINLADLLALLDAFKDIVCVVDACQTDYSIPVPISMSQIKNERILLLFPSIVGTTALCHKIKGSFLINVVCQEMEGELFQCVLNNEGMLEAFVKRMCIMATKYSETIKDIRCCQFQANKSVRNQFADYCNLMKKITKQNEINGVTVYNDEVRKFNFKVLENTLKNLKAKNKIVLEKVKHNCDDFALCKNKAHEGLEVVSGSRIAHTYRLCFSCAVVLIRENKPTIAGINISSVTVNAFYKKIEMLVNDAYSSGTKYKNAIASCKECKSLIYQDITDPNNVISKSFGLEIPHHFVCQNCIFHYL